VMKVFVSVIALLVGISFLILAMGPQQRRGETMLSEPSGFSDGDEEVSSSQPSMVNERRTINDLPTTEKGAADSSSVAIFDHLGRPIDGAKLIFWKGTKVLPQCISENGGIVKIPQGFDCDGVAILVSGRYPLFLPFTINESRQNIELPVGKRLGGRFVTDQGGPGLGDRIILRVSPSSPEVAIPKILLARLEMSSIFAALDSSGNFEFLGLPDNWVGELRMPKGYLLCSYQGPGELIENNKIQDLVPVQNLFLDLKPVPGFTGRLVTPDGGTGVPGIEVLVEVEFQENRKSSIVAGAVSDKSGNFFIPVPPVGPKERFVFCEGSNLYVPKGIKISLKGTERYSAVHDSFDLSDKPDPWFLGSMRLQESRPIRILVRDLNGAPIQNSFAVGDVVKDADESGIIMHNFAGAGEYMKVFAEGYNPVRIWVSPESERPILAVLSKATSLVCKLRLPEAVSSAGLKIRMIGHDGLLVKELKVSDLVIHKERLNLPIVRGRALESEWPQLLSSIQENTNEVHLWGFQAGISFQCILESPSGKQLAKIEEIVFRSEEERVLEFEVQSTLGTISGLVTNKDGAPVAGALVSLFTEDGPAYARSDEKGEFNIIGLSLNPVEVLVVSRKYAPYSREGILPTMEGTFLRMELGPPRSLDVFFVNPNGESVKGVTTAFKGGLRDRSLGLAQRIAKVPMDEFVLRWRIGSLDGRTKIPANVSEYEIELPIMGTAKLNLRRSSTAGVFSCFFVLQPTGANVPQGFIAEHGLLFHPGEDSREFVIEGLLEGEFHAYLKIGSAISEKVLDLGEIEIVHNKVYEFSAELN